MAIKKVKIQNIAGSLTSHFTNDFVHIETAACFKKKLMYI
jgi:hypothetical protein